MSKGPKFETISNEKNDKISKQNFGSTERFEVFQNLDFFDLLFLLDFVIRISDFK